MDTHTSNSLVKKQVMQEHKRNTTKLDKSNSKARGGVRKQVIRNWDNRSWEAFIWAQRLIISKPFSGESKPQKWK